METSQLSNLGDIASLLQLPAQSVSPAQALGLPAANGKPFSQVMQQLSSAENSASKALQSLLTVPETAAVTALNPNHKPLLNVDGNGKLLPPGRQPSAETEAESAPSVPVQLAPLPFSDSARFPAPVMTAGMERALEHAKGRPFAGAGSTNPVPGDDGAASQAQAEPARDTFQKPQPQLHSPLLETAEAELTPERTASLAGAGRNDSDTDTALKTALPFELPKKSVRADEVSTPVTRAIDGVSSLSFARPGAAAPPPDMPNQAGLTEKAVADAFTEKVVWMTGQGAQRANLQLHPAELGALQIRVTMMDNSAHVEIHAQNADTGDLLESLLPKLQSALEQQGIKVDELKLSANALFAETGGDKSRQALAGGDPEGKMSNDDEAETDDGEAALETLLNQDAPGTVDYYA